MARFDTKEYWENRLRNDFSLRGAGFSGLGKWYNYWMYRVRKRVFSKVIKSVGRDFSKVSVLDVGSGTGFYVERWEEIGVTSIFGLDFTAIAIEELRKKYPSYEFFETDIGSRTINLGENRFEAISAFDILFHIVDDNRFERSIKNMATLLKHDGFLFFSDNFLHNNTIISEHQVCRSLETIESNLVDNGLEVIDRVPMFFLMNVPFDSRNLLLKVYWRLVAAVVSRSKFLGFLIGAISYPIKLFCVSVFKESPTTEVMICRKIN